MLVTAAVWAKFPLSMPELLIKGLTRPEKEAAPGLAIPWLAARDGLYGGVPGDRGSSWLGVCGVPGSLSDS